MLNGGLTAVNAAERRTMREAGTPLQPRALAAPRACGASAS
jgi:hypothetical protein